MTSPPKDALEWQLTARENLTTLASFLLAEERQHPQATGQLSWILSAIALASKVISSKLRRARIDDVIGALDTDNVQGERQQKLDVIANEVLMRCLGRRAGVAIVASEENEEPIILRSEAAGERPYCVLFDPLDGSSNIDCNGGVGTIFSILRHDRRADPVENSILQPGVQQVAAGYVLYGPSNVFVLTTGQGVHMFVLEPMIGTYLLVQENLKIPEKKKTYSLNEAYRALFPQGYRDYLDKASKEGYSSRYAGAMVADVHRTLIQGGVFMYPPTDKAPAGKLRLMYEANPMAMLVEQAGGRATAGLERILEIQPKALHQRTSVILGSTAEVDKVLACLAATAQA